MRKLGLGLLGAVSLCGMLAGSADAAEYNVKGLPEFGRCLRIASRHGTGAYNGPHCISHSPGHHGRFEWLPGPASGASHVSYSMTAIHIDGIGRNRVHLLCTSGAGEGEYTSEKTAFLTKLVLNECQNPAVAGVATYCQKSQATLGEIEAKELTAELGFINKKRRVVGIDLAGPPIVFECEGGNEVLKKGDGLGPAHEIIGSVIGKISPLNNNLPEFNIVHELSSTGTQFPENFEGQPKDTWTMLVGSSKEAEPMVLTSSDRIKNATPMEIKARCRGEGC